MTSNKAKPAGKPPARKEAARGLKARKALKSSKPSFKRQEGWRHAKLKDSWRKPKGRHSKMRKGEKARGKTVRIGYGSPAGVKGLNRLGYREVRVHAPADIGMLDPKEDMAVIASSVGKKKREELLKLAAERKVHVSNA